MPDTRNEASSRRMQDRLAGDFRIDEHFATAADLPQGVRDEELQAEYGRVARIRYREVLGGTGRRLAIRTK